VNGYRLKTDVLIIGSGIAGSIAALTLAETGLEVTLITAGEQLASGNSRLAQGGIVYTGLDDDPKKLERDILTAGWKQNYTRAVRYLCRKGPEVVRETLIEKYGVHFDERQPGDWYLTREGGHSVSRILCCADHTGRNIVESLHAALEQHPNIRTLTRRTAVDLLTTHHHARGLDYKYSLANHCVGAYVFNGDSGQVETILADYTLLATGGVGQIFLHTTNTRVSIGSGLSMAFRAGARIFNAEYIQFHPTAMFAGSKKKDRRFLISEAVRGEGAKLINSSGEAFMSRYDSRADLAPRDIVTRAIMDELLHSGEDCVYLDVAGHVDRDLRERFPTIFSRCQEAGVNMEREPIPVVPAAHYFCGGILADTRSRTTLERLYAAGECACTGLHGANRLASTSLLESLLWGYSAAQDIQGRFNRSSHLSRKLMDSIPDWESPGDIQNEDPALIAQDWASIRHTMWNYVGISRTTARLGRAFSDLRKLSKNLHDFYKKTPISKPLIDLFHGCQAAYCITAAALRNKDSKGCHYRVD
jgi:L-aspartate oxidase